MKIPKQVKKLAVQLFWALISFLLIFLIVSIETKEKNLSSNLTILKETQFITSEEDRIVRVVRVADGDTLWVRFENQEHKVRMVGINAAELKGEDGQPECYAEEARDTLRGLVDGKDVAFSFDDTQDRQDRYGRALGYISLDGADIGEILIREGHAREFTYRKAYENQRVYRSAEDIAQESNLGIWSCS